MFDRAVLGIDPGLSRCGYGAVHTHSGRPRAVACGVITTPPRLALPDRLVSLHEELEALVAEINPSAIAVERVLFQTNVSTAISVGQASGLALLVAAKSNIPVTEYSPNAVKLAVTGDGSADKIAVQTMVARMLRLDAPPTPADAADALALALTHTWTARGAAHRTPPEAQPSGKTGFDRAVADALARESSR